MALSIDTRPIALLLLLPLLTARGQLPCDHDQILDEPLNDNFLYIRYSKQPCSGLFWYYFCEDSGWGDEEATVVCRELGYSYGVSGFSEAVGGARGYSSINCDGSESRLEECTVGEVDLDHYCSSVGVTQCYVPQVYIIEPMEVGEGQQVEVCVSIEGSLQEDVQVLVETRDDGLALANFDYVLLNSTITFGPLHPEQQCVQIKIVDDSLAEGLEQFTVELTTTSLAVNITNNSLQISIKPNDFESGNCTEGSVTVSSNALESDLQLVEMCSSEGVWSPVCDNNWTQQDATVVCRELKQDELDGVEIKVVPGIQRGTVFPECSGNEPRLVNCLTTPGNDSACSYVLVDCDSETTEGEKSILNNFRIIMSIAIVILIILILVIVIGICSIIYSSWRIIHRKKSAIRSVSQVDSPSHSNANTLSQPHHTHQEDSPNNTPVDVGLNMENPTYTTFTPNNHSNHLSDTPEHNLINPLYDDAEEPPLLSIDTITPPDNHPPSTTSRLSDSPEHNLINPLYAEAEESPPLHLTDEITECTTESVAEHQYAVPHDVTTDGSTGNEAVRYHQYEYVDGPLASNNALN